jgi:hypothetical protein
LALNNIYAKAAMLAELLVGDTYPTLSQNQAFDNRFILASVGNDKTGPSFRKLVRDSLVRVRLYKPSLLDPAPGDEPGTLRLAFTSALRNPNFVFSAWPELHIGGPEEQRDRRTLVLDRLARNAFEDLTGDLGDEFTHRLGALLALNDDLRTSHDPEYAQPVATDSLELRLWDNIPLLKLQKAESIEVVQALRKKAHERQRENAFSLNTRSGWIAIIDDVNADGDLSWSDHRSLHDLLDAHYNDMIRMSLGIPGALVGTAGTNAAQAFQRSVPGAQAVQQAATMAVDERTTSCLTPHARLAALERYQLAHLIEDYEGKPWLRIAVVLTPLLLAAPPIYMIGDHLQGGLGALITEAATVAAVVTVDSLFPKARAALAGAVAKRRVERISPAIRTGTSTNTWSFMQ